MKSLHFLLWCFWVFGLAGNLLEAKTFMPKYHSFQIPPTGWYANLPRDQNGVVQARYAPPIGLQYNVVTIAQYGIVCYDAFAKTGNQTYWDAYQAQLDYIFDGGEHLEIKDDKAAYKGLFPVPERNMPAGRVGCMGQGLVASLMIRAHKDTGNNDYLVRAKQAINSMLEYIENGGSRTHSNLYDFWVEEYATDIPSHVLNGYIFAYISLLEYEEYTGDQSIPVEEATISLKAAIEDCDLGFWTTYDANLDTPASAGYMGLHVDQMEHVYQLTQDSFFQETAKRWTSYLTLSEIKNTNEIYGGEISEIIPRQAPYHYLQLNKLPHLIPFLRVFSRYGDRETIENAPWVEYGSVSRYRKIMTPPNVAYSQYFIVYKDPSQTGIHIESILPQDSASVIKSLTLESSETGHTINCELSHGKEDTVYEFWIKAHGIWSILQPYSSLPSAKLEFSGAGEYAFSVSAKPASDANGDFRDVRTILYEYQESPFEKWTRENGINKNDWGNDLDGDDANQYIEYIYQTNPHVPDSDFALNMQLLEDNSISLMIKKPDNVQLIEKIVIEHSSDLQNWEDTGEIWDVQSASDNYKATLPQPSSDVDKHYYRATFILKEPD